MTGYPPVTVSMPLHLTSEMINAVRTDPLCAVDDIGEWHTRLGWLICAYDAMVSARQALPAIDPSLLPTKESA